MMLMMLIIAMVIIVVICVTRTEYFSDGDRDAARKAYMLFVDQLNDGTMQDVSDQDLKVLEDDIHIAIVNNQEGFQHPINSTFWPQHYYSQGGRLPSDMFSRLKFWSPGFYTGSGLSFYLRPGLSYKGWPRNRWVKKSRGVGGTSYYYITNGGDYTHNAAEYGMVAI